MQSRRVVVVQISWSKDGSAVRGDKHYQVENAADRGNYWTRLTVYDVQPTDHGQFSVTAVNGFGSVTSSASLTVRGIALLYVEFGRPKRPHNGSCPSVRESVCHA